MSFAVVGMATQSFMPDMQALSSVQQNSPVPQQQQSPQSSISQPNHSQSNQATHSQTSTLDVRTQTVTSSLAGSVTQGSQTAPKTQTTIQGVSVSSAIAAAQVVVATHSPPISQSQQQSEAVVQATQSGTPSQFIAVAVSEHENPGEGNVSLQPNQAVHPTYVQYVDSAGEPNIYATNNGQMTGYSVYSVTDASAMYTPATAGYYTGGSAAAYSQLIEESGGYKVQGQVIEADAHHNLAPVSAAVTLTNRISPVSEDPRKVADIISPFTNDQCVIQTLHSPHDSNQLQIATPQQNQTQSQPTHHSQHQNVRDMDIIHVQWLIDNYETAEGVSLPRSTLYNHYLRHCSEHKLDPVNAASFGKLIRSVFLGLRTRRLGTRGNSKYHYYGIRVKPNSPLNQISEENSGLRQQTLNQIKNRFKTNLPSKSESNDGSSASSTSGVASQTETPSQPPPMPQHQHQQFLGDASAAIPNFIEIDTNFPLPDGITLDNLETFKLLYREHCEAFLDAVVGLQFAMVETLWQSFWRTYNNSVGRREQEKLLSKTKFYQLCKHEPVLHFIRKSDYQFYQNLVDVLIPDVLRPIPSSLTQAIRNFAKCLESWLTSAMTGCPDEVIKVKVSAVSAFAQTLRRYTSLNHLAQAARAVLQNSSQISQMMADLNRVDFHNVQEQASWVCQCDESTVQHLEQDFKMTLQQQNSLEQWARWLENVVDLVLQPYDGKPDFPKAARQFLLKWSFYSSMVIRDLTLRSAASFGSFHLIRLLYDEYMFYLIEHRVAKAINETPIAVMGEFIGLGSKMNSVNNDLVLNSKNISVCGTSKNVLENGSMNESNCNMSQDMYSSNAAMTNGLKEAAAMQASLIGQPQVRFMSSVSEAGNAESISQHSKKLKAV